MLGKKLKTNDYPLTANISSPISCYELALLRYSPRASSEMGGWIVKNIVAWKPRFLFFDTDPLECEFDRHVAAQSAKRWTSAGVGNPTLRVSLYAPPPAVMSLMPDTIPYLPKKNKPGSIRCQALSITAFNPQRDELVTKHHHLRHQHQRVFFDAF